MTGSIPNVSKKVARVISHHLYYSVCSKCPPPARTQALADSTFNNRVSVTQSGPFGVDASFQFVDVRDLGTIDSFPKHTPHGV